MVCRRGSMSVQVYRVSDKVIRGLSRYVHVGHWLRVFANIVMDLSELTVRTVPYARSVDVGWGGQSFDEDCENQ